MCADHLLECPISQLGGHNLHHWGHTRFQKNANSLSLCDSLIMYISRLEVTQKCPQSHFQMQIKEGSLWAALALLGQIWRIFKLWDLRYFCSDQFPHSWLFCVFCALLVIAAQLSDLFFTLGVPKYIFMTSVARGHTVHSAVHCVRYYMNFVLMHSTVWVFFWDDF